MKVSLYGTIGNVNPVLGSFNPTSSRRLKMKVTRRTILGATAAFAALPAAQIISTRARATEFSFKYGNQVPVNHPVTVAFQRAVDRIKIDTGGRVEINMFPNNALGGDTDMLSQLRSGALEFFTCSPLVLSSLVSVAAINGLGFAFKDSELAWGAMDGDLGELVRREIRQRGLTPMEKIWDSGYRQITSGSKPINSADDLVGFKIRVPVSPLWTSMFKAFGAAPVGINFSEVYSALQTKVVDGQETPLVSIDAAKLYEVQKYCSVTNHMWDGYWCLANTKAFERMPKNLQEIVASNINQAALEQRKENLRLNQTLQGDLEKKGLIFNKPDPASFRAALTKGGFYTEWREKFGAETWKVLEKYSGELA
jgi:tripartite ATP-independent transporter DctP family solute receptor